MLTTWNFQEDVNEAKYTFGRVGPGFAWWQIFLAHAMTELAIPDNTIETVYVRVSAYLQLEENFFDQNVSLS